MALQAIRSTSIRHAVADEQHQLYIDYLTGKTNRSAEDCVRFHLRPPAASDNHKPVSL